MVVRRWLTIAVATSQAALGARVLWRLARTANGRRILAIDAPPAARVTVIVPVLDERERLGPCLDGLIAQGPEVAEILVVDGGSTDGTTELVAAYAQRDDRVRLVDARPVPAAWNGKVHGLEVGLDRSSPGTSWVLTVDADVRPGSALVRSLLAHAEAEEVVALSVATQQRLSGAAEALVHPALLTTLVYRFGIPGHATDRVAAVQANGQCFLVRRDVLLAAGGFASVRDSVCEDVTLARGLAAAGHRVGFYESDDLVVVAMYAGWRDAWRNWTRSLPLRDRYSGLAGWLGLAEVALVQALPLPLAVALAWGRRAAVGWEASGGRGRARQAVPRPVGWGGRGLWGVNLVLAVARVGVLVGTARAYPRRPWTYWLSPLHDVPVAGGVWLSAVRRRHVWRGRVIVRGGAR